MDKIWVKDVKEGERLKSVFLVARKAVPTAKSGKTYLSVTFQDKTGELEARAFERVEELAAAFEEKDYVEVEGPIGAFQGKPQLKIEAAGKIADAAALDAAEFTWVPPPEPKKPERPAGGEVEDALWNELLGLVDVIVDTHVKSLVKAFVEDEDVASRMRRAAAAKSVHHAYAGGLLEHTVSSLKLAHRIADHYPQVDRDLLVAGAFFHDLGKIRELQGERNVEYTDEGRLVGHLVMTAQWVHDKARRVGVPRDLEHHVVHMILAHHGRLEYGSPKPPMTLEALLTHYIDELDSRVNSWLNLMAKEGGSKRWTSADNVYEQPIWRGQLPTVQAEKKGPPPELMTPVIYVPREGAGGQGGGQQKRGKPQKEKRRPEPRPAQHAQKAGEPSAPAARAAEGSEPRAEGAAREARPERPPREHRGGPGEHRGGPGEHRGPGGFGDKKRGYTGPRLPGDKGPHRPPEKRSLTHNPFAALAAKLEDAGKTEAPQEASGEVETPPVPGEAAAPVEAPRTDIAPEPTSAPTETPAEPKPGEGT
ncbi:HD domain-containing protein [Anaeromyxobacter sp. Fw109-5]|uniref:HD domain-containing protein n=1 Tax=Anaeromyxobacter sp. (strain Fw109-5) TaxID=404589 RepID=UPI0000ED75D8|nr:HD domain-containing protein [Anaeromyxobacter sp. Fw109-5]ABS26647.1 metal dependent phosphohydrolase [Anaeromyxobacter sp. Fw109-5]